MERYLVYPAKFRAGMITAEVIILPSETGWRELYDLYSIINKKPSLPWNSRNMFYAHEIHEKLTETSLQRLSIKNPYVFFCYRSFRISDQGAGLGVRQLLTSGPYFCYTDNTTKIFPHHSFMSPGKAFPNRLIVPKKMTYFGSSISIDHHHL